MDLQEIPEEMRDIVWNNNFDFISYEYDKEKKTIALKTLHKYTEHVQLKEKPSQDVIDWLDQMCERPEKKRRLRITHKSPYKPEKTANFLSVYQDVIQAMIETYGSDITSVTGFKANKPLYYKAADTYRCPVTIEIQYDHEIVATIPLRTNNEVKANEHRDQVVSFLEALSKLEEECATYIKGEIQPLTSKGVEDGKKRKLQRLEHALTFKPQPEEPATEQDPDLDDEDIFGDKAQEDIQAELLHETAIVLQELNERVPHMKDLFINRYNYWLGQTTLTLSPIEQREAQAEFEGLVPRYVSLTYRFRELTEGKVFEQVMGYPLNINKFLLHCQQEDFLPQSDKYLSTHFETTREDYRDKPLLPSSIPRAEHATDKVVNETAKKLNERHTYIRTHMIDKDIEFHIAFDLETIRTYWPDNTKQVLLDKLDVIKDK